MVVVSAMEKSSKYKGTPGLEVDFQILNGTTPGQTGKDTRLFLSYVGENDAKTKACLNRLTRLAMCVGVIRPGQCIEPNWDEAVGRELVIEVEAREYEQDGQKKQSSQVSFLGFWSLGNPDVADVPKDDDSEGMKALRKNGGPKNGNGSSSAAVAKATPELASVASDSSDKNKWADF